IRICRELVGEASATQSDLLARRVEEELRLLAPQGEVVVRAHPRQTEEIGRWVNERCPGTVVEVESAAGVSLGTAVLAIGSGEIRIQWSKRLDEIYEALASELLKASTSPSHSTTGE